MAGDEVKHGCNRGCNRYRGCGFSTRLKTRLKGHRGAALSETGPAFFLLFLFAVFPVIDLIFLGISYFSCITLNDLQSREAARVAKSEATSTTGSVQGTIPNQWRITSLGQLARLAQPPVTSVSYQIERNNIYVTVATTCSIQPLLMIPFFPNIPGIGAPVTVFISRSKLLESPRNYGE